MKTLFRLLLAAAAAVALVQPQPLAAQAKKNGAAKSGQTNAKSGPASAKSGTAKSDSNGGQSNGGQLGTFGDWEAYADARDGFCYAGTKPTKQEGKYEIFLRGIGTNSFGANAEQTVAIYVDGVFQPSAEANLFNFNNVERVEVLKGPQGTLFGRNTPGGVVQMSRSSG